MEKWKSSYETILFFSLEPFNTTELVSCFKNQASLFESVYLEALVHIYTNTYI